MGIFISFARHRVRLLLLVSSNCARCAARCSVASSAEWVLTLMVVDEVYDEKNNWGFRGLRH